MKKSRTSLEKKFLTSNKIKLNRNDDAKFVRQIRNSDLSQKLTIFSQITLSILLCVKRIELLKTQQLFRLFIYCEINFEATIIVFF